MQAMTDAAADDQLPLPNNNKAKIDPVLGETSEIQQTDSKPQW